MIVIRLGSLKPNTTRLLLEGKGEELLGSAWAIGWAGVRIWGEVGKAGDLTSGQNGELRGYQRSSMDVASTSWCGAGSFLALLDYNPDNDAQSVPNSSNEW